MGTVIFHIDATGSMSKEDRMVLTKQLLLRVIPNFLRQGFRVLVNSWATSPKTQGKVQTKEIVVPSPELLEPENEKDLVKLIEELCFSILNPFGKTDLYGSLFQLFRQCKVVMGNVTGPIHSFVLTDGNHNKLGFPLHKPETLGESYFELFDAVEDNGLKFKRNKATFEAETCQRFLREEFDALTVGEMPVSLTIVGIGEAETEALSSLADKLGDKCVVYGITELSKSDEVFRNTSVASLNVFSVEVPDIAVVAVSYSYEDDSGGTNGGGFLPNTAVHKTHKSSIVRIVDGKNVLELHNAAPFGGEDSAGLHVAVEEFITTIRKVRCTCYDVTEESFRSVFGQLLADKNTLRMVKSSFYSKTSRKLRKHAVFAGIGVWLKELVDLIDAQIDSYRMNVEGEILNSFSNSSSSSLSAAQTPSAIVLQRLQNNVSFLLFLDIPMIIHLFV